jgi:hypothetical protein
MDQLEKKVQGVSLEILVPQDSLDQEVLLV